jgi:hypothetical protein
MQTSKDPLAPLRCWKELLLGERALKAKTEARAPRSDLRFTSHDLRTPRQPLPALR